MDGYKASPGNLEFGAPLEVENLVMPDKWHEFDDTKIKLWKSMQPQSNTESESYLEEFSE